MEHEDTHYWKEFEKSLKLLGKEAVEARLTKGEYSDKKQTIVKSWLKKQERQLNKGKYIILLILILIAATSAAIQLTK